MSAVLRNSQRPQDASMFTFFLFALPRQTGKVRKKTTANDDQMSGLSDSLSNPGKRHVLWFAHIVSSQSISRYSRPERWQDRESEM